MKFFDPRDSRVFEAVSFAILVERRIHLARTKDYALNILRLIDGNAVLSFGKQRLEVGSLDELFNIRTCKGVTE